MPFLRKYNTLTVTGTTAIRIPIIKRGVVDFAVSADWTPAAGDVKIAIGGAAAANVTNLPTAVAMGNGAYWEFILTAAELTCKSAVITVADSATKAVEDQAFIIETFGHASAMYQADLSAANLPANVAQFAGTEITSASGIPEVKIASIAANAVNASAIATDAVTEIQNGLASQSSVDDLPTNAELATALASSDDAMLSAIATVQSDTNDIQTRLPAALESGRIAAVLDSAARLAIWNTLTTEAFTADSFGDLLLISDGTNGREVKVTGANHIAADVHDVQPDGLSGSTEVAAINTFATRVTTGLVAHGAVYQFTANMLELGPSGTGGDATLAKQTEILAAVAGVTSSVASHAARLALEVQIQGFPAVICRNSDYVTETESEIRLTLQDLTGTAITEIAGTPVASLAWLFGMGTEAAPAIIAGAVTWDAGTSELVIQFARSVTAVKPLGSITWQIGVSTGSGATLKNRWLGGGTTRLIERQF